MDSSELYNLADLTRSMHDYEMSMSSIDQEDCRQFNEMDEEDQAKYANAVAILLDGMLDELLAARALINKALEMPELPED